MLVLVVRGGVGCGWSHGEGGIEKETGKSVYSGFGPGEVNKGGGSCEEGIRVRTQDVIRRRIGSGLQGRFGRSTNG